MSLKIHKKLQLLSGLLITVTLFALFWVKPSTAVAQVEPGDVVECGPATNFSRSPGYSSVDPFIIADPAGTVHLFWAERINGAPDAVPNAPDAVMYSSWNGSRWSTPVDLFLSPPEFFNKRINAIRGVIDDNGYLHITWIGPDNYYYYSSVHASQAGNSGAWREQVTIADDQSGSQYSADITSVSPNKLHIVYGREIDENGNQVISHIQSEDGGMTWTDPQTVYTVPYTDRGASNIRVWANGPEKLYLTWTEWDASGNGQIIFFARSLDGGQTWEEPTQLAQRYGEEYERDWVTLAVLGEDQLVAFWEGGYRAYRQAQYSADGGATWTDPKDTLDWLIADNGFAEFVQDGDGRYHLFVFQRVREGNDDRNPYGGQANGLWHSVWEGGTDWRQPEMVGVPNTGNFVTVAVRGGNELFAAWFSYIGLELSIIQCKLAETTAVPLQPWPEIITTTTNIEETEEAAATSEALSPTPTSEPTATPTPHPFTETTDSNTSVTASFTPTASPGQAIFVGLLPAIFLIMIITLVVSYQRRRHAR